MLNSNFEEEYEDKYMEGEPFNNVTVVGSDVSSV